MNIPTHCTFSLSSVTDYLLIVVVGEVKINEGRSKIIHKQVLIVESISEQNFIEIFTEINLKEGQCVIRHIEPNGKMSGTPVLLLPGIGGFAETYLYNFSALVDAGFHPMAIDNVGFGKSSVSSNFRFTPEIFSRAIANWSEKIGINEFFVGGNSFGGGVALGLWPLKREQIKGFILISPAGFDRDVWFLYKLASLPLINRVTVRMAINGGVKGMNGRNSWKPVVYDPKLLPDYIVEKNMYYRTRIETRPAYEYVLKEMMTLRGQHPEVVEQVKMVAEEIRKHQIPTLVIWGKNDKVLPPSQAEIAAEMTGGKMVLIDECGHMPYLEHPAIVNDLIVNFLHDSP